MAKTKVPDQYKAQKWTVKDGIVSRTEFKKDSDGKYHPFVRISTKPVAVGKKEKFENVHKINSEACVSALTARAGKKLGFVIALGLNALARNSAGATKTVQPLSAAEKEALKVLKARARAEKAGASEE